jgi:hypothetical protein
LNIFRFQARKIGNDLFGIVTGGETGEHSAKRNASPLEHGVSTADLAVSDNAIMQEVRHTFSPIIAWVGRQVVPAAQTPSRQLLSSVRPRLLAKLTDFAKTDVEACSRV